MIWEIIEQSGFDAHFQDPGLTIEHLLVDENILTEMQNLNPRLLSFIQQNREQVFSQLVKYVVEMPRQEEGYDRCHRLPYVSSEMLGIGNQLIYDAFLAGDEQQSPHLSQLFSFLGSPAVDNQILLGYFEKVVGNLYKGRKIEFTRAVIRNLSLFEANLDKQAVGSILKSCVILLDTREGELFAQRKQVVSRIITQLVQPANPAKSKQVRQVCSSILTEIIGRHKTYSSGDELLRYMLEVNAELLLVYSLTKVPEIVRFLIGVLTKSTQKIYNPETDSKTSIFRIPAPHQALLVQYIVVRLQLCRGLLDQEQAHPCSIPQQDGTRVVRVNKQVLDFLTLVSMSLENQIDGFMLDEGERLLGFAWECMRRHARNDIMLVQVDKIFAYVCSHTSETKQQLHTVLLDKFRVVEKLGVIFSSKDQQKILRPHLFQLWRRLKNTLPANLSDSSWIAVSEEYEKLVPLHTKVAGLNYTRPADQKIVVDETDAKPIDSLQLQSSLAARNTVEVEREASQAGQKQEKMREQESSCSWRQQIRAQFFEATGQSIERQFNEQLNIHRSVVEDPFQKSTGNRDFGEFEEFFEGPSGKDKQEKKSEFGAFDAFF